MSNKTKGLLMLAPIIAIVVYTLIFIWGWASIPILIVFCLINWWMGKARELLSRNEKTILHPSARHSSTNGDTGNQECA